MASENPSVTPGSVILGLDTSAYTTSVALVDSSGNVVDDRRRVVAVPPGERGLSQSAALFQHVQELPLLLHKTLEGLAGNIELVAVSTRPRPREDSYMPVFTVGLGYARALAAALKAPLYTTSHQEGHLAAAWGNAPLELPERFLAIHLSGGTSEVLLVTTGSGEFFSFTIEIVGGTTDLYAGQLVDRVGVAMGLPFPCGPYLEGLAAGAKSPALIPSSVKGMNFSFSGAETRAHQLLASGIPHADVAKGVENCLAKSLEKIILNGMAQFGVKHILLVGGVMANSYLSERLRRRLEHKAVGAQLFFAPSRLSGDNAVGVALIGLWSRVS